MAHGAYNYGLSLATPLSPINTAKYESHTCYESC